MSTGRQGNHAAVFQNETARKGRFRLKHERKGFGLYNSERGAPHDPRGEVHFGTRLLHQHRSRTGYPDNPFFGVRDVDLLTGAVLFRGASSDMTLESDRSIVLDPLNRSGGPHRVLLMGPDSIEQREMQTLLESRGFRTLRAEASAEACHRVSALRPDVVVADLKEEDSSSCLPALLRLLGRAPGEGSGAPLVVLQQPGHTAVAEALKQAGAEVVEQPLEADEFLARLTRLLEPRLAPELAGLGLPPDFIIGRSEAIQKVFDQVRLVAPPNTSVLITGETGTGKERISQAIHRLSHRRRRAMISVNCGGIPATLLEDEFFGHVKGAFTDAHQPRVGRFEQAHHGTIFLDEIADLPLELQPKLLRVLQEREIHRVGGAEAIQLDVRVIAATNVDLWNRVAEGRFREDLFYRINVFPIHLPPLRERPEDIPLFAAHFLEKFCRRDKLGPKRLLGSAEVELMSRPWPGNIRELENAVEIAVIRSQDRAEVQVGDLPPPRGRYGRAAPAAVGARPFRDLVGQFERDLLLRALETAGGNKTQAALALGLKRTTLIEKLKKLGVAD